MKIIGGIGYNKCFTFMLDSCRMPHAVSIAATITYLCEEMNNIGGYITVDSETQNGQPVFTGTRVPVQTLFWHLEKGITIEEFLEDFPSVSKEQAIGVLEIANKIVNSAQLDKIYETVN